MSVQFTPVAQKRFAEIVARYPKEEAALLPVLWLAQDEFGHLSEDVRSYVAKRLNLSLTHVESVISFYTLFHSRPTGKNQVQVCRNPSCRLRGSEDLTNWMERELGVRTGETSSDGSVTFCEVECIAACGGAPAVRVNDDYVENADPKDLERVIGKLRGTRGKDR